MGALNGLSGHTGGVGTQRGGEGELLNCLREMGLALSVRPEESSGPGLASLGKKEGMGGLWHGLRW